MHVIFESAWSICNGKTYICVSVLYLLYEILAHNLCCFAYELCMYSEALMGNCSSSKKILWHVNDKIY